MGDRLLVPRYKFAQGSKYVTEKPFRKPGSHLAVIVCLLLASVVSYAGEREQSSGCAAFSGKGDFARAVLLAGHADISVRSGDNTQDLQAEIKGTPVGCELVFSADWQAMAVAIHDREMPSRLQIEVFHRQGNRWNGAPLRVVRLAPDSAGKLRGFLNGTDYLFVLGRGTYYEAQERTTIYPVFVPTMEEQVATAATAIGGGYLVHQNSALDLPNTRLWVFDSSDCALKGITLIKTGRPAAVTSGTSVHTSCDPPDLLAVGQPHSIVTLSNATGLLRITATDLDTAQTENVALPPGISECSISGESSIAPSGRLLAVMGACVVRSKFRPETIEKRLLLLSLAPAAYVGSVTLNRDVNAFAIDEAQGSVQVATLAQGAWHVKEAHVSR